MVKSEEKIKTNDLPKNDGRTQDEYEYGDLSENGGNEIQAIAKSDSVFAPKLYEEVITKTDGNVILSALSVESVLAIAFLGAKGNTEKEIKKTMSLPSNKDLIKGFNKVSKSLKADDSVTTQIANHVYVKKGAKLLDSFKKDSEAIHKGIIQDIDFSNSAKATKSINKQVEKDTKGKIKDLFSSDSFDANTQLVLVNALYFKGKWNTQFDKKATEKGDFYVSSSKTVKADMMRQKARYSVLKLKGTKATALKLPYKGDRFHMVVILPDEKDGLDQLQKDLSKVKFSEDFKFEKPSTYRVGLPKFKIETKIELIEKLRKLGIKDLFDIKKADLSGFTGSKGLYASALIQKAFIEVNEEGSEAAAATGMVVSSRSLNQPPSFVCDHPFIFFIKDSKTGIILFTGRVVNPTK